MVYMYLNMTVCDGSWKSMYMYVYLGALIKFKICVCYFRKLFSDMLCLCE